MSANENKYVDDCIIDKSVDVGIIDKSVDVVFINVLLDIKKKIESVGFNIKTLHIIIKYVMEATEQTPIKGKSQKQFALRIIKELIENIPDSNNDKALLLNLYNNDSISNTIELVVSASKGQLGINNVVEIGSCLWSCIKSFLHR